MRARLIVLAAAGFLMPPAAAIAQDSLRTIEREFEQRRAAAAEKAGGFLPYETHKTLFAWLAERLERYLDQATSTGDRTEARLLLASTCLVASDRDRAAQALRGIEPTAASMTELLSAAELAGSLAMKAERGRWIDAALDKQAPFEERMRAGAILMTRLVEPERAERLFDAELQAATDDEGRATVTWYRANATREREDLEDGAYESALDELTKRFPNTLYGGIARDRLRAMAYEVGSAAVEIAGSDLGGERIALSDLRGQVVLLWYWASWSRPCRDAAPRLRQLLDRFAERGLDVLGINLDEDRAAVDAFGETTELPGRTLCDSKGPESPLALRNNVEHVPHMLLVDREGKIAALRLSLYDEDGFAQLAREIERALGPN